MIKQLFPIRNCPIRGHINRFLIKRELDKKFSIRWRKSSATFVIYQGRRVWESGFETEQQAQNYLDESKEREARNNGKDDFTLKLKKL